MRWDWVWAHTSDIGQRVAEHCVLAGIAVLFGFLLAFGLAILIRQQPLTYEPITWVAGVIYTVPSLALFALLIPFTGLSLMTAEIGLIGYTQVILVRNIVSGLRSVAPDIREAAIGMGCTSQQLLWRVELPLALPIIVAGLRVTTVSTIGLTTVTALIGQGGLGFLILDGIQRFFSTPLLVGAFLSVLLAIGADLLLVFVERLSSPWKRAIV
ncbi:MAG: ABC transporter permease [Chloroflexi bacterium]|nr:ABC transporter permease [Chloroflexota bacterium]